MSSILAKNTLYLTIAAVGQKIIAFAYFLFLARIMGPDQTGTYFLATSIAVIYTVIADFGITPVVIREIAKNPEQAVTHVRTAIGTKIPLMVLAVIGAISTGVALGYDPLIVQLIIIASIVLILDSTHLLFYGALRGVQKLQYEAIGIFIGQITTVSLGALVLWLNPSLHLLILALLAGSLVGVIFSATKMVKVLSATALRPRFSKKATKMLLKIALPFALAAIFVKIYSYVDSIFISKFFDTTAVGIYAIAYKFTYAFQFLPLAFIAALYPGLSSLVGKDERALNKMFNKAMWYMMILAIPITLGIWVVAPELVLLAGDGYADSAIVLQLLVFVLIPIFLDFPIGSLLNAANRQVTKTTIMGFAMVVNVILNAALIPKIGVLGAAYAAIISFTGMFLAGLYFVNQVNHLFKIRNLIRQLIPIAIAGVFMALVATYLKPIIGWIPVIPVAALVYVVFLFILKVVTKEDVLAAKRLISR
ncbi:flippase [Candidatus Uhrbacteria bacterium]|nr:flippase [Candidatus Uhrbacteria bacterium]